LSPDCSEAVGVKMVKPTEFWVSCHIPGRPLMPGVLMIEAAAQLSSIQYKKRSGNLAFLGFIRCENVVFRGQVVPGDQLLLLGKEVSSGAGDLISTLRAVVGDRLVFEAQITGMVL